jgi:hypothetical protein
MHEPINVKSHNNTSKWQVGFNSAFKGLTKQYSYNTQDRFSPNMKLINYKIFRVLGVATNNVAKVYK